MVRQLRRIAVAFVGGIVVAVGVAMIVLPGPAILVIPAGLAILATEFPWARRLLHRVRDRFDRGVERVRGRKPPPGPPPTSTGASDDHVHRATELRAS